MQFFIHKNCFELSLSVHFLFCEILNLIRRLPFAVYVMLKLFVSIHKNAKTGTNFASIQPATFIVLLIRPDACFFFLCYATVKSVHRNQSYYGNSTLFVGHGI